MARKKEEELKMSEEDFKKKLIEFQEAQTKFLGCVEEKNQKSKRNYQNEK